MMAESNKHSKAARALLMFPFKDILVQGGCRFGRATPVESSEPIVVYRMY
jgi:hypothetical protein